MKRKIVKMALVPQQDFALQMPEGSKILSVTTSVKMGAPKSILAPGEQPQQEVIEMPIIWVDMPVAEEGAEQKVVERKFHLVPGSEHFDPGMQFIGTFYIRRGQAEVHLFEVTEEPWDQQPAAP